MSGYLLGTNITSHFIRGDRPGISKRLASLPIEEIAISAVTEGDVGSSQSLDNNSDAKFVADGLRNRFLAAFCRLG